MTYGTVPVLYSYPIRYRNVQFQLQSLADLALLGANTPVSQRPRGEEGSHRTHGIVLVMTGVGVLPGHVSRAFRSG